MSQKVIILELNEVPLRLLEHYSKLKKSSSIAHLLERAVVLKTLAKDVVVNDLYPAQTWASYNTGVPCQDHHIRWYNDPKPDLYPMYWKIIANSQLSVSLVNSLHSSEADKFIHDGNYKFIIPDCFANSNFTFPAYYQSFQSLNIKATNLNSRTTTLKFPIYESVESLINFHKLGITPKTIFKIANLLLNISTKQVPKERLRCAQFSLLADIFLHQTKSSQSDLSIFFTNHIAANMHRYWYALFPDDYSDKLYNSAWIDRYKDEIIVAVDFVDKFLDRIINLCIKTNSVLIVSSSMGQQANQKLTLESTGSEAFTFKFFDIQQLIDKLSMRKFNFSVKHAMHPQCTLEFSSSSEAAKCLELIEKVIPTLENIRILSPHLNSNILTLTILLDASKESYTIKGESFSAKELGFVKIAIDDHHSGSHSPDGSLLIFNSKTTKFRSDIVNYLEFTPAILKYFDIQKLSYTIDPTFQI
jgi:hypothetical protein